MSDINYPITADKIYLVVKQACQRTDNKQSKRITQQDIADGTNISPSTLSKFFAGYSKNPDIDKLVALITYVNNNFNEPVLSFDRMFGISKPFNGEELHELETQNAVKDERIAGLEAQLQIEKEANSDLRDQIKKTTPFFVTLVFAILLSVVWNVIYVIIDVATPEAGFVQQSGINTFLYLIAGAVVIAIIFTLISWSKSKQNRKEGADSR